jgi:hypothetical protein
MPVILEDFLRAWLPRGYRASFWSFDIPSNIAVGRLDETVTLLLLHHDCIRLLPTKE